MLFNQKLESKSYYREREKFYMAFVRTLQWKIESPSAFAAIWHVEGNAQGRLKGLESFTITYNMVLIRKLTTTK
jgi:hypothetical protein